MIAFLRSSLLCARSGETLSTRTHQLDLLANTASSVAWFSSPPEEINDQTSPWMCRSSSRRFSLRISRNNEFGCKSSSAAAFL